MHGSPKPHMV